jgi:hypothetical protein
MRKGVVIILFFLFLLLGAWDIYRHKLKENEHFNIKQEEVKITIEDFKLEKPKDLVDIILESADKYSISRVLLHRIAICESQMNPNAIGRINEADRGLFQLNSYYTKVSNECAFDPKCSSEWTAKAISEGELWRWNSSKSCWNNF